MPLDVLLDHPAFNALDEIENPVDWRALEPLLPEGKGQTGRPGYASLTLFWSLLLGLWHDLSDVKLEAQLARDLMLHKFCRLTLTKVCHRPAPSGGSVLRWKNRGGWRWC